MSNQGLTPDPQKPRPFHKCLAQASLRKRYEGADVEAPREGRIARECFIPVVANRDSGDITDGDDNIGNGAPLGPISVSTKRPERPKPPPPSMEFDETLYDARETLVIQKLPPEYIVYMKVNHTAAVSMNWLASWLDKTKVRIPPSDRANRRRKHRSSHKIAWCRPRNRLQIGCGKIMCIIITR